LEIKKTIAIYGTGSSADDLIAEFTENERLICFYETHPDKKIHKDLPVLGIDEIDESIDEVFIASVFYPEIIELLVKKNISIENFTVAIAHLDDPRYGPLRIPAKDVLSELDKYIDFRKTIDSIKKIVDEQNPFEFNNRLDHLTYAYSHAPVDATSVEFGVYRGESLLHLANISNLPVWGFDSFSGLSEGSPWTNSEITNRFDVELPICLKEYRYLVEGYFEDTLVPWIKENNIQKIGFVHYDAGHYKAAKYVLEKIESHLIVGSILVFDEFVPTENELHANEFQALNDTYFGKYKILSKCDNGSSTSVTIRYEG
jgi:hypothetical protein